jgi:hypothetical protein
MSVVCYPGAGKRKALKLSCAFAEGCGGEIAGTGETRLRPGAAFFYGMTAHTLRLIGQCQREGREWYYADNAYYFGRGDYFRVSKGRFQHDGLGNAGPDRFAGFGVTIRPWRRQGSEIVIATQSELFHRLHLGIDRRVWVVERVAEITAVSDRPIRICHKPEPVRSGNAPYARSFETHLADAWAVVTHSSSAAVKALIEGVPVFCTAPCMASVMGLDDLARIETPVYPDGREPWLWNLAANQWTLDEIRDGTCWRALRGVG